jgi:hypothetical protein
LEKAVRVSPKLRQILDEADRLDPEIPRKRTRFEESVRRGNGDEAAQDREVREKSLSEIAQKYRWW